MQLSPGDDCNGTSFLHVEVWDLRQLLSPQEGLDTGSSRADPLLGIAQNSVPNATFISSGTWDVRPAQAVFDTKGYELMRPYMHVQSPYRGAISNGSWYVSLQNLDFWTSGLLDFQIKATCSQQPQCPAPFLNTQDGLPRVCSGLTRSAGDPVLFLKPQLEGFQAGGVPAVQDYQDFADISSFQDRVDMHHTVLTNVQAGTYYVAVYNNDAYFKETAQFRIQAQAQLVGEPPGDLNTIILKMPRPMKGFLQPGQWHYYEMTLDPTESSWMGGLMVDFENDGGHSVLLMKVGSLPTLTDADFTFRSKELVKGEQLFLVKSQNLQPAVYFIAVFNENYYLHQRYSHLTAPQAPVQSSPAAAASPGIDSAIVQTFPTYLYKAPAVPDVEQGDISHQRHEEACSVCLGEYEVDERVKRLPPCGHEFHEACIDLWLTNHVTCPMCRCSLLPPQANAAEADSAPSAPSG
ncbi:hypothetical protein WJX75_000927 [Coccomyxa subellipsoidea]|uniref:RING-type domain-containing protein n=1 Tax=Coccomyxa subellipsoidea TaxID=248742 RepID=A0ABR2YPA7_9CHLO